MYPFRSSVIAISAVALLAPLTPVAAAATGLPAASASAPGAAVRAAEPADGRTQSLPLTPLDSSSRGSRAGAMGLSKVDVEPFTMVGVAWKDPEAELHGRVQVRVRSAETGRWSGWQDLEAHTMDAPDPGSGEGDPAARRGGTAPLWVGDSDGVEVRVLPEQAEVDAVRDAGARSAGTPTLPEGLSAELIDPGPDDAGARAGESGSGADADIGTDAGTSTDAGTAADAGTNAEAVNAAVAPAGATEIAEQSKAESEADAARLNPALPAAARPYIGPRPGITTRKGWGANESWRERKFKYTKTVNIAFVHHSATGNNYTCRQAPRMIRGIYRYHTKSLAWADIGYNFLIDKCGRIYEGRSGGVTRAVQGAHTYGFNHNSMGIAVLGSYGSSAPSKSAVNAVSRLTAWKLGLFGRNPKGKQVKVSGGGKYKKGRRVRLNVISGHRDGFATSCPGSRLYGKLGATRASSARYQGRK